jgi:plasmid stability protein
MPMASLTVRNLDERLKKKLRLRAANNGRSMEEEARKILQAALGERKHDVDLGTAIRRRFARFGNVELDIPPRGPARPLPTFDE